MFGPVSGVRITTHCDTQQTELMVRAQRSEQRESGWQVYRGQNGKLIRRLSLAFLKVNA